MFTSIMTPSASNGHVNSESDLKKLAAIKQLNAILPGLAADQKFQEDLRKPMVRQNNSALRLFIQYQDIRLPSATATAEHHLRKSLIM